jgi:CO/xanthine dehydrogenase FAD-binding subunit
MITEYHRPKKIEEALQLLARQQPVTVPLGGGTALNRPSEAQVAVVDLQALGLDEIHPRGNFLDLGATVRLEQLLQTPGLPPALERAIRHEAGYNLRQVGTVAGSLVAADGRSPFATAMLGLDATLSLLPALGENLAGTEEVISLGDLLPMRAERLRGRLITRVTIPLNASLAYEYVARTPADRPIVCVAVARWPSGRTRIALGGCGPVALLALDGPESGGAETAVQDAFSQAGDQWASAEYRQAAATTLIQRILGEGE